MEGTVEEIVVAGADAVVVDAIAGAGDAVTAVEGEIVVDAAVVRVEVDTNHCDRLCSN